MRPTKRLLWLASLWTLIGLAAALNTWLPASLGLPQWQDELHKLWQTATV